MTPLHAAPPVAFRFGPKHRSDYKHVYWSCPERLVTDGTWAELWQASHVATSVLLVLALEAYRRPDPRDVSPFGWRRLSLRRIQPVSGVGSLDAVRRALRVLRDHGCIELPELQQSRQTQRFRLCPIVLPCDNEEPRAQIPALLAYGGLWGMLPTPGARHLFVALACLDGARDEAATLERLRADGSLLDGDDEREALRHVRERHGYTLTQLRSVTGLGEKAVSRARDVLTTLLVDDGAAGLPLVDHGPAGGAEGCRGPRWYAPNRVVMRASPWPDDVLNDAERRRAWRDLVWPGYAGVDDAADAEVVWW